MSATDFIRRAGRNKWWPVILLFFFGCIEEVCKAGMQWVLAIGKGRPMRSVEWTEWVVLLCGVGIGCATTFAKLKSSAWSAAEKKNIEPAGGP